MEFITLTRNDHHAYGEDLLIVGLRGNVSETDAGHTRHGEVQRSHVHGLSRGTVH